MAAVEAFEDVGEVLSGDAHAGILHLDMDLAILLEPFNFNATTRWGVLNCVFNYRCKPYVWVYKPRLFILM